MFIKKNVKMSKIYKLNDSVIIEHNGDTYVFPITSVLLKAEEASSMVNVSIGGSTALLSIPNQDIENHSVTAIETVQKLNNEIY